MYINKIGTQHVQETKYGHSMYSKHRTVVEWSKLNTRLNLFMVIVLLFKLFQKRSWGGRFKLFIECSLLPGH